MTAYLPAGISALGWGMASASPSRPPPLPDTAHLDVRGRDPDDAAGRHGVAGVDGEIDQHLMDLALVGAHRCEVGIEGELQPDLLAEQALEHPGGVLGDRVQVEDARLHDLPAAERQQLLGQRGGALGGRLDLLDLGAEGGLSARLAAGAGIEPVEDEAAAAEDRGQEVVEVVRDAAGEPPDRLHLLRLAQLLLERLAVGDVDRHADRADDRAIHVAQRLDVAGVDAVGPVLFVGAGVAADRRADASAMAGRDGSVVSKIS